MSELCARCDAVYGTCCRTEPDKAHLCFPLSEAEWERIKPFEHLVSPYPGRMFETNTPGFVAAMRRIFPGNRARVLELFPPGGLRSRIATNEDGECVFLGAEGCILPRAHRPWYCRIFPLWVYNGRIDFFMAQSCLICEECRTVGEVLATFGLSAQCVLALSAGLHRDWGLE